MRSGFGFLLIGFLVAGGLFAGCASTVARILPIGEPVTAERCQGFDAKTMGVDDGKTGQRQGEKFEFWHKDCAIVGVKLDRSRYDEGYLEGLADYCSCEQGFVAGIKEEFTQLKGQYQMCRKSEYKNFMGGHEKGKLQVTNQDLVKKINHLKTDYNEPAILSQAKASCSQSQL